jgi:hypothetical protein
MPFGVPLAAGVAGTWLDHGAAVRERGRRTARSQGTEATAGGPGRKGQVTRT